MAIDIANPGADLADLRSAVGALVGRTLLTSGVVTVPVTHLDITLPAGFSSFKFTMTDLKGDDGDGMALLFSDDAGMTFGDEYHQEIQSTAGPYADMITTYGNAPIVYVQNADNIGYLNFAAVRNGQPHDLGNLVLDRGAQYEIEIRPGDASTKASYFCRSEYDTDNLAADNTVKAIDFISATLNTAVGRQNLFRFRPYIDDNITAGTYHLFGVPSP